MDIILLQVRFTGVYVALSYAGNPGAYESHLFDSLISENLKLLSTINYGGVITVVRFR